MKMISYYELYIVILVLSYYIIVDGFQSNLIIRSRISKNPTNIYLYSSVSSSSSQVIELTQDGGVKKEVIEKGTGKKVEDGDILAIQYEAKLKNLEKVIAKGEQEKFVLKDGSLIKGWDIGLSSMRVGEKARVSVSSNYAYGDQGIIPVIPPGSDIEINVKILAWLGNQLRPESLFSKDLDIDPFVSSTPEQIQADYDDMQAAKNDKYEGNIADIYLRRIKNISFGFGGSNFFASQSGDKAPWWLNPNITFPTMISICLAAFVTVISFSGIKEKGERPIDLDVAGTIVISNTDKILS